MKDLINLVGIVVLAAAPASDARPGEWTCDRATDSSLAILTALSKERNATLVVRCSAGKPRISLRWGMAGGSGPVLVTTQLDDAEPTSAWWPRSVDRKEFQFAGDQAAYLRGLQAGKALGVRLTPEAVPVADAGSSGVGDATSQNVKPPIIDVPLVMTFDLTGLGAAISAAQANCGMP